jgi:hypothetical protein
MQLKEIRGFGQYCRGASFMQDKENIGSQSPNNHKTSWPLIVFAATKTVFAASCHNVPDIRQYETRKTGPFGARTTNPTS